MSTAEPEKKLLLFIIGLCLDMIKKLDIMKFQPVLKSLPWGGRKLASLLNKTLPDDAPYGESWEIVDLPSVQSIVNKGPWQGASLASIVKEQPQALMGNSKLSQGRFPLLFKFIDANDTLSVQVHPDEAACKKLGGGARPKTEAWFILHAEPGAKLYLGLQPGVAPQAFEAALQTGKVEELLKTVEVKPGDFYFIPAGLVHAIGKGIVLAEIQQVSDTTYRVFDWNRVGLDGKPRQLHIKQALASIKFDLQPVLGQTKITCPYFSFEQVRISAEKSFAINPGRPKIIASIRGTCHCEPQSGVAIQDDKTVLTLGETCLIPASVSGTIIAEKQSELLLIKA
ncbi:MAG: type I phosphomannose isomerase catalytic subunit [Pseudomonadota bacterium]